MKQAVKIANEMIEQIDQRLQVAQEEQEKAAEFNLPTISMWSDVITNLQRDKQKWTALSQLWEAP